MVINLKTASPIELTELLRSAHLAGMAAGRAASPPTMIVRRHANPLDDNSPVLESYAIPDGPCGFAWVTIKPANSRLAKAMERYFAGGKNGGGNARRDSYEGGMMLWVWEFNQSMVRKEAYARAFANVLREAGAERVYAGSRID